MCRLYGFLANERTKVECTLVHAQNSLLIQSRRDQYGREHADGWGIAFYGDDAPILETSAAAAFIGLHFGNSAERVYSRAIVAHARKKGSGFIVAASEKKGEWFHCCGEMRELADLFFGARGLGAMTSDRRHGEFTFNLTVMTSL